MARGNTYTCLCCGKEYEFCPKCTIAKPAYDAENFCSAEHSKIFAILSKNGCGLASADETLAALKGLNTTNLSESVEAHIKSLQPKVEVKKEVETTKKNSFRTHE